MERTELFTKEDIESFPNFDSVQDKVLFDAIQKENLIIFYGAGVSALANCPTWERLALNIIKKLVDISNMSALECKTLEVMAHYDPRKVITIGHQIFVQKEKIKQFHDIVEDSLVPIKNADKLYFERIHKKIFDLKPISFITTNIDRGMEMIKKSDREGKKIIDVTTCADLSSLDKAIKVIPHDELRNSNIFYLHGCIKNQESKPILTLEDYFKFYYQKDNIKNLLKEVFCNHTVLFIGYSLSEYEVLQNIYLAVTENNHTPIKEVPRHYLLSPIYTSEITRFNLEKEYWKMFSIKAIPYFIDFKGYHKLLDVIDNMRSEILKYAPKTLKFYERIDASNASRPN